MVCSRCDAHLSDIPTIVVLSKSGSGINVAIARSGDDVWPSLCRQSKTDPDVME